MEAKTGAGMKTVGGVFTSVLLGLLFMVNVGHAVTIDSLQRSVYLNDSSKSAESSALGTFDEKFSWPGTGDYNAQLGSNAQGARVLQDTSVLNSIDTMTVSGGGIFYVWWPDGGQQFTIQSNISLGFTPFTNASYNFSGGGDGGIVTFRDITTNVDMLENAVFGNINGFLVAGDHYQVVGNSSILNWPETSGDATGGFWGLQLTVTEVPSESRVPEPATFLLFGAGLAGVAFMRRRNKK
jgi:hypothetical protein